MMTSIADKISEVLTESQTINTKLQSEDSRLVIEKFLPYLCIYRYKKKPDPKFEEIVKTQASYLICSSKEDIAEILVSISKIIADKVGTMMILELWPGHANSKTFKLFCGELPGTTKAFKDGLLAFTSEQGGKFQVISNEIGHPAGLTKLFSKSEIRNQIFFWMGLEIPPLYRGTAGTSYPIYFRGFKSFLSDTIKRAVFAFIRVQTPKQFSHHTIFGKTEIDQAARLVDQCLSDLSDKIDFLLLVSPINTDHAWKKFKKGRYKQPPNFKYRMIGLDPEKEKHTIYGVPMDRIEDPALSFLLRDKRRELSKQLSMLEERGTDNFRYIGQSIYGVPGVELITAANYILNTVRKTSSESDRLDCYEFQAQANKAFKYYQNRFNGQKLTAEVNENISGLIVSQRCLMIGSNMTIPRSRVQALIEHEIGTHILTFCNGFQQPLRLMSSGFAGYDELQEGLAVLAEYLTGGLNANRLRLLAARVLAVDAMVRGSNFMETFALLIDKCELKHYTAFKVVTRVYRGGGLTKDAIYLKGLKRLVDYIKDGGKLEILYTGKFNFKHIPLMEELLSRSVLKAPVLPRIHHNEESANRLSVLHQLKDITDLINIRK